MASLLRFLVAFVVLLTLDSPVRWSLIHPGCAAHAGFFSFLGGLWPEQPEPEDPHLYPDGSLLYNVWSCKGETDLGWIGVTRQFTDQDPFIVVVVRSEFPEQVKLHIQLGVELRAPRHNMIVAADRINLIRDQDVGFFYQPRHLARLGGWGEYKVITLVDGIPQDEFTFRLDRQEDLDKQKEEVRLRKEAEEVFKGEQIEAKSLLGEPDSGPSLDEEAAKAPASNLERPFQGPQFEVKDPEMWEVPETPEENKVVLFPKKARRTWQENVHRDLKYRIQYYIFL
jgi:hypothetical protein